MRIKNFKDFTSSVNESEWSYYRGKTPFSRWLRKMDSGFQSMISNTGSSGRNPSDRTLDVWDSFLPSIGSLVAKSAAAVTDFFFKGKKGEGYTKMSKRERDSYLNDWEKENIKGKEVTEKDASAFYKSGILKGKKYFGKDFDPKNPKTEEEEDYVEYLSSAMEKYYKSLKK